jgi:hypothetical protein
VVPDTASYRAPGTFPNSARAASSVGSTGPRERTHTIRGRARVASARRRANASASCAPGEPSKPMIKSLYMAGLP